MLIAELLFSLLLWCGGAAAAQEPPQGLPQYTVFRAAGPLTIDGRLEEASWRSAPTVGPFSFPWWTSGEKEPTEARVLWDGDFLYVGFLAHDHHISATLTRRDDPVSQDDAVEVFVAPDTQAVENYYNFEFNALGTILDCSHCRGMSYAWTARGLRIAVTRQGTINRDDDVDSLWTAEIAIPFRSMAACAVRVPPRDGDVWRVNLYRAGGRVNPQYSLWSNTLTPKPQYHVPRRFGIMRFSSTPVTSALHPVTSAVHPVTSAVRGAAPQLPPQPRDSVISGGDAKGR